MDRRGRPEREQIDHPPVRPRRGRREPRVEEGVDHARPAAPAQRRNEPGPHAPAPGEAERGGGLGVVAGEGDEPRRAGAHDARRSPRARRTCAPSRLRQQVWRARSRPYALSCRESAPTSAATLGSSPRASARPRSTMRRTRWWWVRGSSSARRASGVAGAAVTTARVPDPESLASTPSRRARRRASLEETPGRPGPSVTLPPAMDVISACPLRVASRVWQPRPGAFALVFVCKATFVLAPGTSPLGPTQGDPEPRDEHWNDDERQSLARAGDLAPFKRRADVLLTGSAYAPGGRPVGSLLVRLVAGEVDKTLAVHGDRSLGPDDRVSEPSPFARAPLRWERAAGGPGTWNPAGMRLDAPPDARGRRAGAQPPAAGPPDHRPPGRPTTGRLHAGGTRVARPARQAAPPGRGLGPPALERAAAARRHRRRLLQRRPAGSAGQRDPRRRAAGAGEPPPRPPTARHQPGGALPARAHGGDRRAGAGGEAALRHAVDRHRPRHGLADLAREPPARPSVAAGARRGHARIHSARRRRRRRRARRTRCRSSRRHTPSSAAPPASIPPSSGARPSRSHRPPPLRA